jgi:DNA-binding NarL/FixJ family response regulator
MELKFEYGQSVAAIARRLAIARKTVDEHIDAATKKMEHSIEDCII